MLLSPRAVAYPLKHRARRSVPPGFLNAQKRKKAAFVGTLIVTAMCSCLFRAHPSPIKTVTSAFSKGQRYGSTSVPHSICPFGQV